MEPPIPRTPPPLAERPTDVAKPAPWPFRRRWTWIAAGSAAALGATGVGLGLWTRSGYEDLAADCGGTPGGCSAEERDPVERRALVTNIVLGTAGAAAVTAAVLWFVEAH